MDESQLPDAQTEKARYLLHENDPGDEGYRGFLNRLAKPLVERLGNGMEGLDYGCGPGPALAGMLEEAGHRMRVYDPFFERDDEALRRTYDFVTCTEVVEHFHRPADEFERLDGLLRPGGWLGIMTSLVVDDEGFADWYYRKDPTHVVFYKRDTFEYLAARFGWECEVIRTDVVLMRKRLRGRGDV